MRTQAALRGCGGGGPQRRGDEFSDDSGIRAQDLMELSKEDLLNRYVCTIKAAGLMRYLLKSEYDEPYDVANKPWVLVKRHQLPQYAEANKMQRVCARGLLL